jgi:Holliday junction DNA helicase RuvA
MFDFIEGTIESIERETITIGTCGVGYRIHIGKTSSLRSISLKSIVRVWTEQIIREDKHELYGFHSQEERSLFCLLQSVSGIGPKVALTISNAAERQTLIRAIANKDMKPLQSIPGIGKKLAERIVVELHEKIAKILPVEASNEATSAGQEQRSRALIALKTLGFKEEEAKERIKKVTQEKTAPKTFEELIQRALQIDLS